MGRELVCRGRLGHVEACKVRMCGQKIVAQGALDQARERTAVLGGACLGGVDQPVIEVEGGCHTEIRIIVARVLSIRPITAGACVPCRRLPTRRRCCREPRIPRAIATVLSTRPRSSSNTGDTGSAWCCFRFPMSVTFTSPLDVRRSSSRCTAPEPVSSVSSVQAWPEWPTPRFGSGANGCAVAASVRVSRGSGSADCWNASRFPGRA